MNSYENSLPPLPTLLRSPKRLADFLHALTTRRAVRDAAGMFLCDGLRFVARAARSPNFRPLLFVYAPELLNVQPSASSLLTLLKAQQAHVPLIRIAPTLLTAISQSPEPQGIAAVVAQSWIPTPRLSPDAGLCYLALDTVRNKGNLGTALRTLEAVGGSGLICLPPDDSTEESVDPFAPGAVRAAMGSTFALRFARPTPAEWTRWRAKHGVHLVGTSPHTGEDYRTVRYGERVVLWMGGERKGLSEVQMAQCDRLVRIPMALQATADSLNLATAASILLYELFHQKG